MKNNRALLKSGGALAITLPLNSTVWKTIVIINNTAKESRLPKNHKWIKLILIKKTNRLVGFFKNSLLVILYVKIARINIARAKRTTVNSITIPRSKGSCESQTGKAIIGNE